MEEKITMKDIEDIENPSKRKCSSCGQAIEAKTFTVHGLIRTLNDIKPFCVVYVSNAKYKKYRLVSVGHSVGEVNLYVEPAGDTGP